MAYGDRCLLVHGHFYQPPRENPWTGQIDPQPSAAPWENWNQRIADECYLPMARSAAFGADGAIVDLYNNYAHTSFNFGPTLLSWLEREHPALIRHLRDAVAFDHSFAMAQAYSHMMLPLADARDRHTQIVWGIGEFRHRFGFFPEGMWLPECGIDAETVRALIDHRIRHLILSPGQASRTRPFGLRDWRDASMDPIDTRCAYRLFDTDGGGRTHFDRFLDIVFYTPHLNLKISFDHILNRPDDLARELENCYLPEYDGAQLVSIVTDGEIYGHHEKQGEEALTRLYRDIVPALGLKIVSAGEFIRDNPPVREVALWNGVDGRGSSWSCEHGMGRWLRDCGCRPPGTPDGWTQAWRGPLRSAFDAVRDRVRIVGRRELGRLTWDADEAFDDYIRVLLSPDAGTRRAFVGRHAQRALGPDEIDRLWRMLEARHNAMLMYTSCGWFFDELSGLEPVQNMRYALRACELIAPEHDGDPVALLERDLERAGSNIPGRGDGGGIFRALVLPSRHSDRELAAATAVCLALDFPARVLPRELTARTETTHLRSADGGHLARGGFVCRDARLDRFVKASWAARLDNIDCDGVSLCAYEEIRGGAGRSEVDLLAPDADFDWPRGMKDAMRSMKPGEAAPPNVDFVPYSRLPGTVRDPLFRRLSENDRETLLRESARLGTRAMPFLARARRHDAESPEAIAAAAAGAFEREIVRIVHAAIGAMRFDRAAAAAVGGCLASARELGLSPSLDAARRSLETTGLELLHWLERMAEPGWLEGRRVAAQPGGAEWTAPVSRAVDAMPDPSVDGFAAALGHGLARILARAGSAAKPAAAVLTGVPVPELLEFMAGMGLSPREAVALRREYWDFLDRPLARLIRMHPKGAATVRIGKRVRRVGHLLGFDPAAIDMRLENASPPGAARR